MAQTYTIWFNTSYLKITSPQFATDELETSFDKVIKTEEELLALMQADSVLFSNQAGLRLLVSLKNADDTLLLFKQKLKLIYAAGGIVWNEHEQILMIKRRGFWDLPKGKHEENEQLRSTAIREVQEETSVKIETASERSIVTFHCYELHGEYCLKETHWFEMSATVGEEAPIPQVEEDIEQAIWVNASDLGIYKDEMYPMIWTILEGVIF